MDDIDEKRERIRRKYNNAERNGLEIRHARKEKNIFAEDEPMRVGVYCRVSTGNTEQLSSYIMQQKYYSEYVERHPSWTLIDIYADEGISGTSLKHRNEFVRMMKDCKNGKLDLIVVKSVSRFARCTQDFLKCIRDLANHIPPIGIYFENEAVYTLDESKQLMLTFLAGVAQEESHTKSTSMNSSIEQRFSHNLFLTPPLLGYDNNEDGNLVINEDESETVKLIFAMYQYGYSCDVIAQTLTVLGRRTKLGNVKWSSSTVRAVLQNERHCGDIVARKTWTPNYLDHKSRKNRLDEKGEYDRNQYYKRDHHTAIISRDDYIAVQKMIANAKYGGRSFMPELRVNSGGALHGFVSVNPRWGSFKTDDYIFASRSVSGTSDNKTTWCVRQGDIDLRGYEIARAQFWGTADMTSGLFYSRYARFSGECLRKLGFSEYVELFVHPTQKQLAVRKCSFDCRNAIRWAKCTDDKIYARQFGGTAYLGTLFDILGWRSGWGYRLRGSVQSVAGESVAFFNASEFEALIPCSNIPDIMAEADYLADCGVDYYVAARSKHRLTAMPSKWREDFGVGFYRKTEQNAQINRVGTGINMEHNTQPDLRPTSREILETTISRLLRKFRNMEA